MLSPRAQVRQVRSKLTLPRHTSLLRFAGTTDLTKYAATYNCKKADGTTVTTLNPNSLNLTYGDNWTCTVTNSQRRYTFSGIVFNDNGGLTLANDLSVPVSTNTTYFNGVYDSSVETGITQAGLTIDLAKNCNATTPTINFSQLSWFRWYL